VAALPEDVAKLYTIHHETVLPTLLPDLHHTLSAFMRLAESISF
jgi:hypothetical protein